MIGGILLGPSVAGRFAPQISAHLFPADSLAPLEVLSTVGLILFLFVIGSELDYNHLRRHRATAALASGIGILLPMLMAIVMAPLLRARFAPAASRVSFDLFLGISMSITAFPVLARILEERGLKAAPIGIIALMCAAVDDVCAWALLAVAITLLPATRESWPLAYRLLALVMYLCVMLFVVRPLAHRLAQPHKDKGFSYEFLAIAVVAAVASASATNAIGVHPLFGAFLAGLCFPRIKHWQETLGIRIGTLVSALLLPLFFALTGLRTRIDLLDSSTAWLWTVVILIMAIAGKGGGAVFAARLTGHSWQQALALGALLDIRGLVELVVLNIAYDAHVFPPELFTMMVVMALLTTMLTVPVLELLGVHSQDEQA